MYQKFALPIRLRILPRFHCAFAGVYASVLLKTSLPAHWAHFPAAQSTVLHVLIRIMGRFLADFRLRTALLGRKIALR
jgi:hypothetical protein